MSELKEDEIGIEGIVGILGPGKCRVLGDREARAVQPSPLFGGPEGGLSFLDAERFPDAQVALGETRSTIIITNCETAEIPPGKALVIVDQPRKAFVQVLNAWSGNEGRRGGVHPSAVVDPGASVHGSAFIGPGCVLGNCTVGENAVLEANIFISSGVRIGRNVRIKAGAVLGNDGFSFEREDDGTLMRFPHFGGVVVEDDVEIGSNSVIDCGTFGDTVIGRGTKIDNLCHIAHNVKVGRDCLIIAHSVVSGSDWLGDGVWLAPGSLLRNGITVGDGAFIGMGAVVIKDVKAGEKVFGNPARPMPKR